MTHLLSTLCLLLFGLPSVLAAGPQQSVDSIQEAVKNFVNAAQVAGGNFKVELTPIDPRLALPLCEKPLDVFVQSGELKPGRNTLGVRCTSGQNWMIYNQVILKVYKEVLVLSKPLHRSELITADAVIKENREVGSLQQGYLVDPGIVVNKQAARNLAVGTVLNASSYADLTLVKRGERVNIQLGKAGMSITSTGTALMNGVKGDRINVRNNGSQRVIQAVIVDAGLVAVNF
jgi:flagellar basal body P-ring formation protein FlgA